MTAVTKLPQRSSHPVTMNASSGRYSNTCVAEKDTEGWGL